MDSSGIGGRSTSPRLGPLSGHEVSSLGGHRRHPPASPRPMRWLPPATLLLGAAGYPFGAAPGRSARLRPRLLDKVDIEPDVSRAVSEQLAARDVSHIRVLPARDATEWHSAPPNAFPANGNFSANDLDCAQFGMQSALLPRLSDPTQARSFVSVRRTSPATAARWWCCT